MMQKVLLAILLAYLSGMSYADCDRNIIPTAPNSRYQLLNNNTEVKDLQTNLIWQRCSLGQTWVFSCTGTATAYTWPDALKAAQNAGGGWRLPNIKELQSLVERACSNPSINEDVFYIPPPLYKPSLPYWSSSPMTDNSHNSSWVVNFNYGYGNSLAKYLNGYVRLVRSSQ
jgi:hypothetical protein